MEPHSRPGSSHNGTLRFPQAIVWLLKSALAGPTSDSVTQAVADPARRQSIKELVYRLILFLINPFDVKFVGMVKLTLICGFGSALWLWAKRDRKAKAASLAGDQQHGSATDDAAATDPGLLKKHSTIRSYNVPSSGHTYPGIRTFYRPHPQEGKLPRKPCPVPLLVFIHGLGGSVAQFNPILLSLSNLASCLAIDLPGCGLSTFEPKDWSAYTPDALAQLLAVAIEDHRAADQGQQVILLGHSMGCSLAALLASPSSPHGHLLSQHVAGIVAICPKAEPPTRQEFSQLKRFIIAPVWLFDLVRAWDRRGGVNSASVRRLAGEDAEEETKRLQLRYNKQSRTPVWQRMARGMCPDYDQEPPVGGLPGRETWSGLEIPVFLAGGESDRVTRPFNVKRIVEFLGRDVSAVEPPSEKASLPIAAAPVDPAMQPSIPSRKQKDSGIDASDLPKVPDDAKTTSSTTSSATESASTATESVSGSFTPSSTSPSPHPRRFVVKTAIMPHPASHALLFAPSTSRILSGLISSFLASHIDPRLSLAWQLQYLCTEGKWDVKNLEKWRAVPPVSAPIANIFLAMKTLREVDDTHTPKVLARNMKGRIKAVVDISHDQPVYDPIGLEEFGIKYYKFPTVSKQPPLREEVAQFIELVDRIRKERGQGLVAVHCHYGFNRTGFFVVCYLVEREGWGVERAIEAFRRAREPGIRHCHFVDALFVRYAGAGGLGRGGTG